MLPLPCYCASRFTWNGNNGSIEASDLQREFYKRAFYDAIDVGFEVKSPKTGVTKTFYYSGEERDGEGELQAMTFTDLTGKHKITVFND